MMLTGLFLAVLLGVLSGGLWAALDVYGYRLTRNLIEETQLTSIIRMVVTGFIAQNLAGMIIVALFHAAPAGGFGFLVQAVLSILIYLNARVYLDSPY